MSATPAVRGGLLPRHEESTVPFHAPLTNHHADGTLCPADHKHTSSGKPLHADCPGRSYTQAVCSCGDWEMKQRGKGYVNECRKRNLAGHAQGPKALRDLLRLDAP
ncbi:hypothetical protein ACHGLA_30700 [Streptomyces sp. YH02]|uniref:hypothetical protein n=1 Tax=Streptomyces sp. YH02 TaxID=3256999 RepID=UPI0037571B1B